MSVCAVMMVKDEADVLPYTLHHLLGQVDAIIVSDNGSTDGTRQLLDEWASTRTNGEITVLDDPEVGYWQSRKTTALAMQARAAGFDWVLPVDADEMWVAKDGRRIGDFLMSIAPDVPVCSAEVFHYIPTAADAGEQELPNPFERIGWRLSEPSTLAKVACRPWRGLLIAPGNHACSYNGAAPSIVTGGLRVNHYSWRTTEQYSRKIVNGARAYAATDLAADVGSHWRMWGDPYADTLPDAAADHFRRFFWAPAPPCAPGSRDPRTLVYDPANEH